MTTEEGHSVRHIALDALRWLLVLPAAYGAHKVCTFLLPHLFTPEELHDFGLVWFLSTLAPAWAVIYGGAYTAPHYRIPTAVILGILYGAGVVAVVVGAFVYPESIGELVGGHTTWLVLSSIVRLAATTGACVALAEQERKDK